MRNLYLDIMELAINVYTHENILEYIDRVRQKGVEEHGFTRLTANLGILIANGRKTQYKDLFLEMMTLCCKSIPINKYTNPNHGNEFSVKEIVLCLFEIEKSGIFSQDITKGWRADLSLIVPQDCYRVIVTDPTKIVGNWAAFGAASEQLRKKAGIGDCQDFIDLQVGSQVTRFDENGLYMEPGGHILYDIVTRLQLSALMFFGYDGKYCDELDRQLIKGAYSALMYQSVTGEIPFGGRSNQFLFNEAALASTFEYAAGLYDQRGDCHTAGMFKDAAYFAASKLYEYLQDADFYHIKNKYHYDTKYGCEGYGYFNKYMATVASFIYLGYVFADDNIKPVSCPARVGGFINELSPYYHKLFINNGEYQVEYDTKANASYDACGIGRIHKKDAPGAICLSVPFAKVPNYVIDEENPSWLSLGSVAGQLSSDKTNYELMEKKVSKDGKFAEVTYQITLQNEDEEEVCFERCYVTPDYVELTVWSDQQDKENVINIPVFQYDGKENTEVNTEEKKVTVSYLGWKCIYDTDTKIEDTGMVYRNRNGMYRLYRVKSLDAKAKLKIKITK